VQLPALPEIANLCVTISGAQTANAREDAMRASGSIDFGLLSPHALTLERAVYSLDMEEPFFTRKTEPAPTATPEVSFGPFRLLPSQFLLLEGDKPVHLGSRALEILIVLLEHPGALVSKRDLMARVWPDVFVEPANLTVHMSALRRTLRDGQDGNRLIINIPGRGYKFVASVAAAHQHKAPLVIASRKTPEPEAGLLSLSSRVTDATDAALTSPRLSRA
jgi:DNA-binding winged helix-turn-helix (wHTH) protein